MRLRDLCDTAYVLQVTDAEPESRAEFDAWLDSPFEQRKVSDRERQLTLLMGG